MPHSADPQPDRAWRRSEPLQEGLLSPLRHRDFRLLAAGALISLLGDGVFRVTIAVQVLAVRNDPRALSLVAASWALAQFVTLPVGGWAADRYDRRTLMVTADLVRAGALAGLAFLSLEGALELWHLCVLGAAVGGANGVFNPTATSFLPDLLPPAAIERANALLGVARPAMLWIIGPSLGAAVIGWGGPGAALGLDAATFFVSGGLLLAITGRRAPAVPRAEARGTWAALTDGVEFVRRRPWAWAWILAGGLSTMISSGAFEVLLPSLLANDLAFGEAAVARALAAAFAAGGLGSVAASSLLGQRGLPRRFMTVLFGAEAVALLAMAGFAAVRATWHVAALGFAVFTLFAVTDVIGTTLLQRLVPRRLLGRVASIDWMASIGLAPVGFAIAGPLAVAAGPRTAIASMGLVGFVAVVALARLPRVRSTERAGPLRDLEPDEEPAVTLPREVASGGRPRRDAERPIRLEGGR